MKEIMRWECTGVKISFISPNYDSDTAVNLTWGKNTERNWNKNWQSSIEITTSKVQKVSTEQTTSPPKKKKTTFFATVIVCWSI